MESLKKKTRGSTFLPPNFPLSKISGNSEFCGIYYMPQFERKGFVGKAINISDRLKITFRKFLPNLKQKLKAEVVIFNGNGPELNFYALADGCAVRSIDLLNITPL